MKWAGSGAAVGGAAAHVDLVDELVDDEVVAVGGVLAGLFHVAPAQHHGAAFHGFAVDVLGVVVHHAVVVDGGARGAHAVGLDHDADKIVVPRQRLPGPVGGRQVQQRQAGLRGDENGNGVGDDKTARAGEFLVVEEQAAERAQLPELGRVQFVQEGQGLQDLGPQRIRNRLAFEGAAGSPAFKPHGA